MRPTDQSTRLLPMNPSTPQPKRSRSRRLVRFILIGAGLCLTPFFVLALVALSYLGLHRDAEVLREQIFAATPAGWSTKVQLNLGESSVGAADFGLRFARNDNLVQARD